MLDVYPTLALDVSTNVAHACLIISKNKIFHAQAKVGQQHSHSVLPLLEDLLEEAELTWEDLKLLVLGQGPGSFTGLRIAAATIAGINASLKLPIWGISSLAITSMQLESDTPIWVVEDARSHDIFLACYDQGLVQQQDQCIHIDSLPHHDIAYPYVCSSDFDLHQKNWHRLSFQYSRHHAMSRYILKYIKNLDIQTLSTQLQPVYLQLSQAERQLQYG
ncbi:MAG: tRNA (adenosine(37)-N6)-threonylcarbamoyltransferase complex dimerization subunit type 1 TsaB [Mariprofundaceae bacterium]|nr:tRNA (adenosine(37)-N6)-threonylcarbamoyltransferase complex dimerization subunit type 1 TsaB [Mariprofundaceae bacterium]